MDDLFQRPLRPIFIMLNFQKKFEKLWSKLKEYKQYLQPMCRIFSSTPKIVKNWIVDCSIACDFTTDKKIIYVQ